MSWYKDWFNSENYLKVYRHRDDLEAQGLVDLISSKVHLTALSEILDMACGAGRHAIAFAQKGFIVTAVDLSQRLITEAEMNAAEKDVKIDFVLSDILEFQPDKQFDLAVNLFTSLGYFENDDDNFAVIRKAYNYLKSGGSFVLDYFNKDYLIKNLIPTTVFSENGLKIMQNRSINKNRVIKNISIQSHESSEEFYESVRLYSQYEITEFLENAGFTIDKKFGDYLGQNYSSEYSPRLIIFAKK